MGGAEKVVEAMHDSFPVAGLHHGSFAANASDRLRAADIRTSAMQRLPAMDRRFRHYFMLYPFAVENFDLSQYDLIFSSSSVTQKVFVASATRSTFAIAIHRCVGFGYEDYVARERFGHGIKSLALCLWGLKKGFARLATAQLLHRKLTSGRRANPKIYGREALSFRRQSKSTAFTMSNDIEDYYLILSRLMPHKRIDLAIEACKRMNRRL
jgi:glycosyltransferase involved in cell wall biosynthesis